MSKMGLLGAIGFSLALVSLTQIPYGAEGCKILSAKSSGPSSILVSWEKYTGATNYLLDLRVKNNTQIAPVVVTLTASQTERDVQGLRPGTQYSVTLKVFQFYFVMCMDTEVATTVPDTSQIVVGRAVSSTSIMVKWSEVPSTEIYYLLVRSQATGQELNLTYSNTSALVQNLHPSTNYDCYVYTANQAGLGSSSKVRTITTLIQPPSGVTATENGRGTVRVTWLPVEDVLLYQVAIRNIDEPTSRPNFHNVTGTKLDVQGILPCSTYLISVSSFNNFLMPSEPTEYTYTTNKLTPVSSVSVDYTCTTNSATVQWTAVLGAESYRAVAMGDNGTQLMCTSQGTSCRINGLDCGQSYVVHVTPVSESCTNLLNSTTATFQTVPCPPKNLQLFRDCSSEVIIFSWEHTNNTDHYMAKAVDSQGVVQECLTEDNSCYFTHSVCGRHYYFTVYSITGQCTSQISETVDIRTAPCIPQNVQTSADCSSDVLLSKWDLAEGALRYTVEAYGNKGERTHYNCSTMSNSCAIQGVHCGDVLTVYITAHDNECASPRTLQPVAETVPCTPQNVSAVRECGADAITVTWKSNSNAIFYVAMAQDSNGVTHSCNSMGLTCKIEGLRCSTNYTAYVIASNFICNSSESEMVTIETAACPPDQVSASLDCDANQALISWRGQPEMNSYTAVIEDEAQGLLSCSTTNSSCTIPNLKCGQHYTVTVSHHDGMCPSMPSEPIYMESVPCGPSVTVDLDCESHALTLDWVASSRAQGYISVLSSSNSQMTYNTTEPELTVSQLECGVDYSVKVMSYYGACVSLPSVLPVRQIPCVPTDVMVSSNCGQSFAQVTWQSSPGAASYQVCAEDADGRRSFCYSNETSCRLESLTCGQVYNIGAAALGNNCSSNRSYAETVQTAPCPPSQLDVSVHCENDTATLTWSSSPNAVSYTGKAVSADGLTVTCEAGANLACQMNGLQCGTEYNFTVSASDGNCQSSESEPVVKATAPCAVQSVLSTLNCSANALTVSWEAGPVPVRYNATAVDAGGTALSCTTEGTSCTIASLNCGRRYTVTVRATGSTCEGHGSVPETVNSVPCTPVNVQSAVECSTNLLSATWDPAPGAASYASTLTGAAGFSSSCSSVNQSCLFHGLQCAQTYMFSVAAVNDRCNSTESAVVSANTAPCDPEAVTADLHCPTGSVTVSWRSSAGASSYTVLARADGHTDSCHSESTSCELGMLQCGRDYIVTVLAGDGKCNSSALAMTGVTTAPCPPVIQNHTLDCASNKVSVTWIKDQDATGGVTVNATSSLGHWASCSSSGNSSCALSELRCGHTYTVQAFAQGPQCWSEASSAFQIATAPCTPANVGHTYSCETGITFLTWDETLGRQHFYATVRSGDHELSCSTNQSDCSLPSLLCGRTYGVEVVAVADHCNSTVPGVAQMQTAPCAPTNVSASLMCENNTAAVSWQHSPGAVYYRVKAIGWDGDQKECTTNGTSCLLPNMHCAQTYVITVTPHSASCKGFDSAPLSYMAGPCPPTDVQVSLQCLGNVGHVTWTAAPQADWYEATAKASARDEYEHGCSSNGTGCSLTDLHCGQTLVVTVVTMERGCMSEPSSPFTFQSAICPPTGVTGVTTCGTNDITVSWDPSPESGASYFLQSKQDGGGGSANYSTSQTSHLLSGLQCGELHTLTVAASDDECSSVFSQPLLAYTAPCPPTNLTAKASCGTNLGTLTWAPSLHAVSYTATMTGSHGHVVSCSSNNTTCSAKLECGHRYTAVVVASSATCNSSTGASLTFDSAPCLPGDVVADLDCEANTFAVRWKGSDEGLEQYTAIAIGSDRSRATCNTSDTNCVIQDLKCGLNYQIVMTTSSVNCGTIEGSDYSVHSAPCQPQGAQVSLECSTNVASVSWENSGPDQVQVVTAVDSRGGVATCNSSSSNCTFRQLSCGESYAVSVVGYTDTCSSQAAVADVFLTAPCVPTHLTARVDCKTGITVVTWDSARGATSYTVYARGSLGHNAECHSNDTNCNFPNLACGQDYNITVLARHSSCVSLMSESIIATTAPCPHSGLVTTLDCDTNTALVSWTPGSAILHYNATAEAFNVAHRQSCFTSGASCNISSLRCGETYRVSVSGQGQNCPSPAQDWNRITTAPCPPTQLSVDSSCRSNNISVTWQSSQGSVSYMAVAENAEGRRWSCNTSTTGCQISGLACGQQYRVYAVGVDEKCMGARSNVEVIRTAPCVPQKIQDNLDCRSGVLNITWQSTGHVTAFHVSVASGSAHFSGCRTDERHCVVGGLQCGQMYSIKTLAQDEFCNSSYSPTKYIDAAPCPLNTFMPTVDCHTGAVSVAWNETLSDVLHTVTAVDAAGRQHNCSGVSSSGCDLTTLDCGTKYNLTVTPSRSGCVGADSPTQTITTVPCVPLLTDVEIDCLANSAWVIFDESAGAEDYVVTATYGRGDLQTFSCNSTSEGQCSLPPLECSRNVTVTLKALDQQCSSAASNAVTAETAPCPPTDVAQSVSCDNHTANISWSAVAGAVTYTATLEQANGHSACCTTSGTSCDIADLPCGEMYMLHVMAEGRTCNSTESDGDILRTAPCVPENLQASVSCSDNVASMTWNHSRGLGQLYKVTAVGSDGHRDECVSAETRCDLTNLRCGLYYTATVTAEHRDCRSRASDSVTIKTVPCTPENVSSVVECEANSLVVSWSESSGADSYVATVQDSNGQQTTCQGTNQGSCSVAGVGCGQIYHVSVASSDGFCDSPPSDEVHAPSVPCLASNIKAEVDCYSQVALVDWQASDGALLYEVMATAASGHNVTCETNSSHCELDGLLCGQRYAVSVRAAGHTCSSVGRMEGEMLTEPCIPEHISTQYSLSIGQVLWDMTAGAEHYSVDAVTEQGVVVSCATNDTYCALYNMVCGQVYSINVTASNHVCQDVSVSTQSVAIMTEPCPPNNVQASVQCDGNLGSVTWEASFGAVAYEVLLAGRDGHSLSCYSNDTFCSVEGLHCGVTYYTNVVAIGETLNSSLSTTALLVSAPCVASDVSAAVDCSNNSARVSWSSGRGADSYVVTAVGADGNLFSCETDEEWCDLTELTCGQSYHVSLTTVSSSCNTETRTNVSFGTRPCEPQRVRADLQCGSNTATMNWEEVEGVELYVATATCGMGTSLRCNSTNSTCQFSNLQCGETYTLSVTAYSNMCSSEVSSSVEVQTGPCQPADLMVSGSCDNETVALDWAATQGASLYTVTAAGDLGYVMSFQTNETTAEAELPCGQLFTFTVVAQDDRCDSAPSLPEEFKTGPCVPLHVQSFAQCENNVGTVSWAQSDGAEYYTAIAVAQDGHTHMCNTNDTVCVWDDLHCGESYTVQVVANDYMCGSAPSNSTSIRMAPCVPENLQSSLNCTMKVGSLTWNASETAEFYTVTAESSNGGHKVQLGTNDTSAFIAEFLCGQEYFLSVQAVDSECTSQPSPPSRLMSEPCPPTNVRSFMNCLSNIAVVSWSGSAGAEFYTATVTQEDGQSASCWSDSEQCGMTNIQCGQNYTVTVVASNEQCNSEPSQADSLQSVPCVPTDVRVEMDCANNQAVVSWGASDGALSYKATAQSSLGATSFCESAGLTCTLTNLTCGHSYTVQVVAEDDICSSLPSQATTFHSVPCTPNIGTGVLDCFTNSALLDWMYSEGALNYTATALSPSGHVSTCTSNFTNCELPELHCGQMYNLTVVASDGQCSSPPSSSLQLDSAPCPPVDVEPRLDCSTGVARIHWTASRGAHLYSVRARGVEEHESGCETESQSCVLAELMCGYTYNISVTAVNSVCNVSQSAITQMKAVPCIPKYAEAQVECESGAVAVSWEPSKGASSYAAVAQGNNGRESTCNSSATTCLFEELGCGQNYSITVHASDGTCSSAGSSPVEIYTVPCVPAQVSAAMVCENDTAVVSWEEEGEEEEGVSSYLVQAHGPDGHRATCNSTTTSCQIPSMHCGQLYNMTVTALDGRCDNSRAFLNLQSVPCKPTNVKASLQCHSNSAAVTWERASGALFYRSVGVSQDGGHRVECNNTLTHCDLSDLQCGQTYSVSVFAVDESCSSAVSDKAYVKTAPCAPQSVHVEAQCADGAMVVSWSPNPDAEYFYVAAVSNTGARHHCNTSGTACTIASLPCGRSYNVSVLSVRGSCEGKPSAVVETATAPCVPRNALGHLDCVTNSVWVTWDPSDGASSYVVMAQEAQGHNSSCISASSPCNVPDLKCGAVYTFHVTAANRHCSSNHSESFEIETGPCALRSISVKTQCNNDTILVEWEMTEDSPLYVVTAEGHDQSLISCNSSTSSCLLQDVRCGMHYSVIVSASSDKCSSLRSPPAKITTVPCVPSNVSVLPSCDDNGATVTWSRSLVAASYQLTATGRDGHVAVCNSTENNCTLTHLHCGQPYSLSVTARGEKCASQPGVSSFRSVPCEPTQLAVDVDCETNSAVLSWDASEGAVGYFGCARPAVGDPLYCDSAVSSCVIEGLECGGIYNFSVESSDGTCNSSFSAPLQAGAAPCAPATLDVRPRMIGHTYWLMASWGSVNCSDVEYLVEVHGRIRDSPQTLAEVSSYWLSGTYYELPMPCSTAYNLTVRSRNAAGVSEPSSAYPGVTAPCPPQNVRYSSSGQSVVLSWDASVFATTYTVYNVSATGRSSLCSTVGLSCQLSDFDPATAEVTASSEQGESAPTRDITGSSRRRRDLRATQMFHRLNKDLETPEVLVTEVSGLSISVQWRTVTDATEYTLVIEETAEQWANQAPRVRAVQGDFHTETELQPRTTYCVRVAAKNAANTSDFSRPVCRNTGSP